MQEDKVTIISADEFEISSPVRYSVSELKTKIKSEEDKIAYYESLKQKTVDGWQIKIDNSQKLVSDLQAQLEKASRAGLEI